MPSGKSTIKPVGLTLAVFMLVAWLSAESFGAGRDDAVIDPARVGSPVVQEGVWRTRTQSTFDRAERALVRRMYMVWDPMPSRDLDFVWIPTSLSDDKEGKV